MLPVPPRQYGGIERVIALLVDELRRRGHQVGLVAHADSPQPSDARFDWPLDSGAGTISMLRHVACLMRARRSFRPDVLHSFSRLAYLLPQLRSGLPMLMSFQREPTPRTVSWAARLGGTHLRFSGCSDDLARRGRLCGGNWVGIPNFVRRETYRFTSEVAADAPLVFLSRLDVVKAPHLAIDIAQAAGRRIVLAGNIAASGPDLAYFEAQVRPRLALPGVEYIGPVDDEQKNRLLGGALGMLVPIQWDEPFGIVFIEALACGTPVIACPRGALPEIVFPGEHGFLINTLDEGVQAVNALHGLSRSACRARFESAFSVEAVVPRYEALYREMLSR